MSMQPSGSTRSCGGVGWLETALTHTQVTVSVRAAWAGHSRYEAVAIVSGGELEGLDTSEL
jgi:hypothetical protein